MASSPFAAVHCTVRTFSPSASLRTPANPATSFVSVPGGRPRGRRRVATVALGNMDMRPAIDENPEGVLFGQWHGNFSFASYDDLRQYLESQIVSTDKMSPTAKLGEVMSRLVEVAMPDQKLAEIDAIFTTQSGLPVVDGEGRCIGVISKKEKARASYGESMMPISLQSCARYPMTTSSSRSCDRRPLVLPLLLCRLEVLLLHLAELPLPPQRATFIRHNPITGPQGVLG